MHVKWQLRLGRSNLGFSDAKVKERKITRTVARWLALISAWHVIDDCQVLPRDLARSGSGSKDLLIRWRSQILILLENAWKQNLTTACKATAFNLIVDFGFRIAVCIFEVVLHASPLTIIHVLREIAARAIYSRPSLLQITVSQQHSCFAWRIFSCESDDVVVVNDVAPLLQRHAVIVSQSAGTCRCAWTVNKFPLPPSCFTPASRPSPQWQNESFVTLCFL